MADGNASPVRRGRGLLALNITNARSFLEYGGREKSRPVIVCGFKWKLEVEWREMVVGIGRKKESWSNLGVKISCTASDPQVSIRVEAKCCLGLRNATKDDLEKQWTGLLSYDPETDDENDEFEFADDKRLAGIETEILANSEGYLADDTLRFLCYIDARVIGAETADGPPRKQRRYEDVTLVVGDKRIYANKGLLAAHCEFFEAAFFGERVDRNKEECELPDVDPDDFEKFKAAIYPPQEALDDDNVFAVICLADRFGAKSLLDKCEEYMLEKLYPAVAFKGLSVYAGLDDLKSKFLAAMSDKELDEWATPEGLRELSKDNLALVLLENVNRRAQS